MARILVVDDTTMMQHLVKATLGRAGHELRTAGNGVEGVAVAKDWRPDLIIMDVMMPEMDGYEATRQVRKFPPTALTPIIILTSQETLTEKMRGFEAGADDYIVKPFEPIELGMRVDVLLKRSQALALAQASVAAARVQTSGRLIACFSLQGGAGVSTLAANLAVALSEIWGRSCLLLDLVLTAGHSALLLNMPLKRTWASLAASKPEEFDIDLVEQHLSEHASGLKLMASPLRPEEGDLVTSKHVSAALALLRPAHDYLVADLAHDFSDRTLAVLDAADMILLPFAPDLASVRSVAAALETFKTLDYPPEKVRLILNWTFPRYGLKSADIERALDRKFDLVITYAPDELIKAVNMGQPVVLSSAADPVAVLLEDYAFRLSRPEDLAGRPEAPSEVYQRVARRSPHTNAKGVGAGPAPKKG